MTPQERMRISLTSAQYLDALERRDFPALETLWQKAAKDEELLRAFQDIHDGLLEEQQQADTDLLSEKLTSAIDRLLPAAEVIRAPGEFVSVSDVATEIFRHTPDRLPAEAHAFNERLRGSRERLPETLGLTTLVQWAEAKFGPAPSEYWKAFWKVAVKLELRRASAAEYHLAARAAPKREEKP